MSRWFDTYSFGEVAENLMIGAYPLDADDVESLSWMGVRQILNLVEDDEYGPGQRDEVVAALSDAGIDETRLELADFGRLPPDALEQAVATIGEWLDAGESTYVHCRAGWQRSAAIAAGVVAIREGIDTDQALALVRVAKHSANPLDHQRNDLRRWWDARGDGRTDR